VLQQTQLPAVADPPPTAAASLYTIDMSTTLTNHTGTFNATAFSQAVVSVIVNSSTTDASGIDVVITAPNNAATRRLQSTAAGNSDITVAYQVQHITGETAASDIQKQLETPTADVALVPNYKALSAVKTVSSATTTTAGVPKSESIAPSTATPITGIIAGVVVSVIAALLMITMWCKRDTLRAKNSKRQKQTNTQLPQQQQQSLPDQHESGLLSSTDSFTMNNHNSSSSSNKIGISVFTNDSCAGTNSVESFSFPIRRKASASSQALEETQSPVYHQQQQQQQRLVSLDSTSMIADSALDDNVVGSALRGDSKQYTQAVESRSATATDTAAATVAGTTTAATIDSVSSTSTELVATERQLINSQQQIAPIATTTAAHTATTGTVAADTTAAPAGTAVVKKSKLPLRASRLAQGFTASIASVLKQGVRDHGSKVEVALEAVGAVAEHIPYVCHACGLCNEVILLFSANAHISSNCAEAVSWAQQMQISHYTTLHYATLHYTAAISYDNEYDTRMSFMIHTTMSVCVD
jgi:hypothetical protein